MCHNDPLSSGFSRSREKHILHYFIAVRDFPSAQWHEKVRKPCTTGKCTFTGRNHYCPQRATFCKRHGFSLSSYHHNTALNYSCKLNTIHIFYIRELSRPSRVQLNIKCNRMIQQSQLTQCFLSPGISNTYMH